MVNIRESETASRGEATAWGVKNFVRGCDGVRYRDMSGRNGEQGSSQTVEIEKGKYAVSF